MALATGDLGVDSPAQNPRRLPVRLEIIPAVLFHLEND
jgi:hypothetical protein